MKTELPYDSWAYIQGKIWPERTHSPQCSLQLCVQYSAPRSNLNVPKQEWIKKMWYIYTMDYYSATKQNKIMPGAATQTDPETVILREVNQREKDKYMILLQFSSVVTQLCPTFCDPMNRSTPGLPVHYQLPESTQIHVH